MRPPLRFLAVLLAAVVLSGCFQIRSVLTVRPDGSASLRDEVTLSGLALMALMDEDPDDGESPLDRAAFEDRAAELGEGVTLASFEPREDGFVAVYEVPDVEAFRYSTPDLPTGDGPSETDDPVDFSFLFEEGDPATLRVVIPKPEPDEKAKGEDIPGQTQDPAEAERALRMMRAFLEDARMTVALELEGEVVETTATYRDGSTVTLLDLPIDALLDAFEDDPALLQDGPPDADAFYDLIGEMDSVRIERPGTVRVRFR